MSGSQYMNQHHINSQMINQITINSNNAIEMSRGELLGWLNELLKTNLAKIQQLGSGAAYCQLMDVLYPGKIPLSKVNWKAKFDYQFVANFKILQQTFTKLGIMKHIEVEKLVKCKYQDNLEFLQWFKKIFDNNGVSGKDYNAQMRRGDNEVSLEKKREKENKALFVTASSKEMTSNSKNTLQLTQRSLLGCASFQNSDRTDENDLLRLPISNVRMVNTSAISINPADLDRNIQVLDSPWRDEIKERSFVEEKEFYLRKFKEIEHLMEDWNTQRSSGELIDQIRKIILVAPSVEWAVEQGEYVEKQMQVGVFNGKEGILDNQ